MDAGFLAQGRGNDDAACRIDSRLVGVTVIWLLHGNHGLHAVGLFL